MAKEGGVWCGHSGERADLGVGVFTVVFVICAVFLTGIVKEFRAQEQNKHSPKVLSLPKE